MTKAIKTVKILYVLNAIENEKFYTPEELAKHFHLSLSSIYKLLRQGELPHIRFGKVYRIPASDLKRYLANQSKKIVPSPEPKIPAVASNFLQALQESDIAPLIIEVWFYGSYARGDYSPSSDIDLHIVVNDRTLEISKALNEIGEKAMESGNYEDLLNFTENSLSEWETMQKENYPLAKSIKEEGILLWKNH